MRAQFRGSSPDACTRHCATPARRRVTSAAPAVAVTQPRQSPHTGQVRWGHARGRWSRSSSATTATRRGRHTTVPVTPHWPGALGSCTWALVLQLVRHGPDAGGAQAIRVGTDGVGQWDGQPEGLARAPARALLAVIATPEGGAASLALQLPRGERGVPPIGRIGHSGNCRQTLPRCQQSGRPTAEHGTPVPHGRERHRTDDAHTPIAHRSQLPSPHWGGITLRRWCRAPRRRSATPAPFSPRSSARCRGAHLRGSPRTVQPGGTAATAPGRSR